MKLVKWLTGSAAVILFSLSMAQPAAAAGGVPVLMYHYIGNNPHPADKARNRLSVTPIKFTAQMDYLAKNGYTPITLPELAAGLTGEAKLPTKPVVLTFDDGYVDLFYNAFPILTAHGFHAVAFIPTGLIDRYPGFHLTWSQIQQMNKSGLFDFEAHSVSHAQLTKLSKNRLDRELADSKAILEKKTGKQVAFLAYPGGSVNGGVMAEASRLGYLGGFGEREGKTSRISMNMTRIRIGQSMSLSDFAAKL